MLQCHGNEDADYIAKLRELANVPIIKAVKVTSPDDVRKVDGINADLLLLDSGTGSGKAFDHSMIPDGIKTPFFLAGGLTPENAAQAARTIRPYGVDMSSGIETDKVKDREKILKAVKEIRIL